MHEHEHDQRRDASLRPKASRIDEPERPAVRGPAAVRTAQGCARRAPGFSACSGRSATRA